jgi:hypothetical protein
MTPMRTELRLPTSTPSGHQRMNASSPVPFAVYVIVPPTDMLQHYADDCRDTDISSRSGTVSASCSYFPFSCHQHSRQLPRASSIRLLQHSARPMYAR